MRQSLLHYARSNSECYLYLELLLYVGHGGSDGLHGYVPSLDHVVADTVS